MSDSDASRSLRPVGGMTGSYRALSYFGRYELLGRIAAGGMAEVFLARERGAHNTKRHVAIKRILPHIADDERFVEMFRDEARLAMHLTHPNICHIYEFGEVEGHHYLSMEWVHGIPLGKLVRRARQAGGIPIPIAVKIASQIAEALHWAHRVHDEEGNPLGLVHRDVSPHNIMVGFDGMVKLLDFGVAKANTQSGHTSAGIVKGKFSYMSPEQCLGGDLDARSDVFSLGVCLFEAVTGRQLFHREHELQTMSAIVHGTAPRLRSVMPGAPEGLDEIIKKALARDRDYRFADAGAFQHALEQFLAARGEFVSSATIAQFLEETLPPEERQPLSGSTPLGSALSQSRPSSPSGFRSIPPPPPLPVDLDIELEDDEPPKRTRWPLIVGAGALAGAIATVFAVILVRGGGDEEAAPSAEATTVAAPAALVDTRDEIEASAVPEPAPEVAAEAPGERAAAAPGIVIVRSTPPGATVKLGDRELPDSTPTVLDGVAPGTYTLALTHRGYEPFEQEVEVVSGRAVTVRARLTRLRAAATPAATGTLTLMTRPSVRAYLGSRLLGQTPVTDVTVPAGTLQIRLVDEAGESHLRAVRIRPGQQARVFFAVEGGG